MLVGNQEEAKFIHDWWWENPYGRLSQAPGGWEYLGEGSFRAAYLAPSGVVYKVQKGRPSSRYQTNKGEYEAWRKLYFGRKMPAHSRLPKLGYFPINDEWGVVAIERLTKSYSRLDCVPGTNDTITWSEVIDRIARECRIGDLRGNNLFLDDDGKTIVPTDLADTW